MNFRDGALVLGFFLQLITLGLVIVNKVDHDDQWETMTTRSNLQQQRHVAMINTLAEVKSDMDAVRTEVGEDSIGDLNLMQYAHSIHEYVGDIKAVTEQHCVWAGVCN
jgi:Fe2+ transport system protein B